MDETNTIRWIDEQGVLRIESSEYARYLIGVLQMLAVVYQQEMRGKQDNEEYAGK